MVGVRTNTLRRLAKAGRGLALALVSALLAVVGAWPTPGCSATPNQKILTSSRIGLTLIEKAA